jgi:CheY-like chemotaxis protein
MSTNGIIFLVDDDPDDREMFRDALDTIGLSNSFLDASDGLHALELLNGHDVIVPAIIFLDLNMPRMNGRELLALLRGRKQYEKIPVIIYSTSSFPKDINATKALGANGYMVKPSSFKSLCEELKEVLNQHLK